MNEITAQVFSEYAVDILNCVFEQFKDIEEFEDLYLFANQCSAIYAKTQEKRTALLSDETSVRKYELLKGKFDIDLENKKDIVKTLDINRLIHYMRLNTWEG